MSTDINNSIYYESEASKLRLMQVHVFPANYKYSQTKDRYHIHTADFCKLHTEYMMH